METTGKRYPSKKRKRNKKKKLIRSLLGLLFAVVLVAAVLLSAKWWADPTIKATSLPAAESMLPALPDYQKIQLYEREGVTYLLIHGYEMLLVNKTYHLPSSYGNGLTAKTQEAFYAMAAAAGAAGYPIYIVSGYRSYATQASIFARNVEYFGSEEEANKISARAGQSEHQSGMGLDIGGPGWTGFNAAFGDTAVGKWLAANCAQYGFILRYPKDKIWATGYVYEPWHFRYVGVELAKILTDSGLTVEEFAGLV